MIAYQNRVLIEAWQKEGEAWRFSTFGAGETIALPELDASLAVSDVYADVWPAGSAA